MSERPSRGAQWGGVLVGRTVFTESVPQWLEGGVCSQRWGGNPALRGRFGLTTPEVLSNSEIQGPAIV